LAPEKIVERERRVMLRIDEGRLRSEKLNWWARQHRQNPIVSSIMSLREWKQELRRLVDADKKLGSLSGNQFIAEFKSSQKQLQRSLHSIQASSSLRFKMKKY
jgi:hypothetical protein